MQEKIRKYSERLISIFKSEFKIIARKFDEKRKIIFSPIKKNLRRVIWFGNDELKKKINPEITSPIFVCSPRNNEIIVSINYDGIYSGKSVSVPNKNLFRDFNFYSKLLKQYAHHEFGHTMLTRSRADSFAYEIRNYLNKNNYEDVIDIPDSKISELQEVIKNSKFGKIIEALEYAEIGRLENSLQEFHADYMVKKRIRKGVPEERLERRFFDLKTVLEEFLEFKSSFNKNDKDKMKVIFSRIYQIFRITYPFFIFDKWDRITSIFKEKGLEILLKFLRINNYIFRKIIINNPDSDSMLINLIKFARYLDKIDFEKIVFENDMNQKDILRLRTFIRKWL